MKEKKETNVILTSIISALSGAIIGILFAPDKGSKTRKKISRESDEYLQSLKNEVEELRKNLNEKIQRTKDEIGEMTKDIQDTGEDIAEETKERAESLAEWTKDELNDKAQELNIEGYTQMSKDELIEALKSSESK